MKKIIIGRDFWLLLVVFVLSRILIRLVGIHFDYIALYGYWQYLNVETLRFNLLRGVWFDHAQPPIFNLILGTVLKIGGSYAPLLFNLLLKGISFANTLLIRGILKKIGIPEKWVLAISLLYMLSPGTIILENELFYTTFISLLLLSSVFLLVRITQNPSLKNVWLLILPLSILCLSRSLYHILWLTVVLATMVWFLRKAIPIRKLLVPVMVCLVLVGSWYMKNKIIFGYFTTSTWIGMNFSRNVFHDSDIRDSSRIESYEPFSPITTYRKFISGGLERKFAGLNDMDLLPAFKNDSSVNENNINYMQVSDEYMKASKKYIKSHPIGYLKNVVESGIIFFTPVTRYPLLEVKAKKMKWYDAIYSLNLSQFAEGKNERRLALSISAIPQLILYLVVFTYLAGMAFRNREISLFNIFIMLTIGYVFLASSFFEHYENMRFRFEATPLFLVLLAQAIMIRGNRDNKKGGDPMHRFWENQKTSPKLTATPLEPPVPHP